MVPYIFYADFLGCVVARFYPAMRGKWFDLVLLEGEVVQGWVTELLVVFALLCDYGAAEYDYGDLAASEQYFEGYGYKASLRHFYLWRIAPFFCKEDAVDIFCRGGAGVGPVKLAGLGVARLILTGNYIHSFLLNSLLGVLVEDYYGIDAVGRASKGLFLQSVALRSMDVSFSSEGRYSGARWCG